MASFFEVVRWLLKNAGKSAKENLAYYIENPSEAPKDIWEWIKENKLTCALILAGILVIGVPLAIGFGPAGPILGSIAAGWQSGIGAVVAGSAFATMQSLAMTGVFTGIGAGLISAGALKFLSNRGGLGGLGGLSGRGGSGGSGGPSGSSMAIAILERPSG